MIVISYFNGYDKGCFWHPFFRAVTYYSVDFTYSYVIQSRAKDLENTNYYTKCFYTQNENILIYYKNYFYTQNENA